MVILFSDCPVRGNISTMNRKNIDPFFITSKVEFYTKLIKICHIYNTLFLGYLKRINQLISKEKITFPEILLVRTLRISSISETLSGTYAVVIEPGVQIDNVIFKYSYNLKWRFLLTTRSNYFRNNKGAATYKNHIRFCSFFPGKLERSLNIRITLTNQSKF